MGEVAAARSSRKYYLDRVLTVLLSFAMAGEKSICNTVLTTLDIAPAV